MEKKQYIHPLVEVKSFNTALMEVFGPASMPTDPNHAPRHSGAPIE